MVLTGEQENVHSDLLNGKPVRCFMIKDMMFCVVLCDSHFNYIFMRNFLRFGFVLLFIFWEFDGVGQTSTPKECGTREPTKEEMIEIISQEKAFKQSLGTTNNLVGAITVYIKFHNVLKTDGTGRNISSEIGDILYHLNQKYALVNITFAQSGSIDYISSGDYNFYKFYKGCRTLNDEINLRNGRDVTNAINIYFVGTITYGSDCIPVNGYVSDFPSPNNPKSSNAIFIRTESDDWRSLIIPETIPHEMGHYFNLFHTFEPKGGDLVDDTPFDPENASNCVSNCVWNCTTYNPDVRNLMSYYHGCRYRFTSGQYQRMQDYGKTYRTNLHPLFSVRYYLDGIQKTLLQFSDYSYSIFCAGNDISMQFNSYGEPYFCTGTFYLQMKPVSNYYFSNISSGVSARDGEVTITGALPPNTPSGYYNVRIYKTQSQSYGDIEEKTIYVNGAVLGVSIGEPIFSGQYLSASSTIIYNATSTCVGNSIRIGLYEDTGNDNDTYWWTKDGLNYTASSTRSILDATQTGTYSLNMTKCGNLYKSPNSIYLKFYDIIAPTITASSNGLSTNFSLVTCEGSPVTLSTNCDTGVSPIWSDGSTSSIRYLTASSTRDFAVNCNNYFCNANYSPPVRIIALNSNTQTTKNGNWQNITLWTSNIAPLNCQTVTIQAGHTVNVSINDAKAKNIIIKGNLNFINVSPSIKGKVSLGI